MLLKAGEDGPNIWAPAISMGDKNEVPGSWLQARLALTSVAIWRVNR